MAAAVCEEDGVEDPLLELEDEWLGVSDVVVDTVAVALTEPVGVRVDAGVPLRVMLRAAVPDRVLVTVATLVREGVELTLAGAEEEEETLAVLDGVVLAVREAVGVDEGVLVGVITNGVCATPRNSVLVAAARRGAPPFSHVSVAVLKPYRLLGVTTKSVIPSTCREVCVTLESLGVECRYTTGLAFHPLPLFSSCRSP